MLQRDLSQNSEDFQIVGTPLDQGKMSEVTDQQELFKELSREQAEARGGLRPFAFVSPCDDLEKERDYDV